MVFKGFFKKLSLFEFQYEPSGERYGSVINFVENSDFVIQRTAVQCVKICRA